MPLEDIAFEHRMYLPLAPLLALLVVGVQGMLRRAVRDLGARRAAAAALAALMTLAVLGGVDFLAAPVAGDVAPVVASASHTAA